MNFKVEFKDDSVKIRKSSSQSNQVFRLPFDTLTKNKCAFDIKNPFIVYILYARNLKKEMGVTLHDNSKDEKRPFAIFIEPEDFDRAIEVLKSNPENA